MKTHCSPPLFSCCFIVGYYAKYIRSGKGHLKFSLSECFSMPILDCVYIRLCGSLLECYWIMWLFHIWIHVYVEINCHISTYIIKTTQGNVTVLDLTD